MTGGDAAGVSAEGERMRNHKRDKTFERMHVLRIYGELVREPASEQNAGRIQKLQNERLGALMRAAWDIPFYRERFERSGTTPDDYACAADLYRFPVLYKDELRTWMDEEAASHPEKYADWSVAPTSGSTGLPLRVLQSPREHAFFTANWLRTMSYPGYNPFTGKAMSRPNSLHATDDKPIVRDSPIQRFGILRHKYMSDTIKQRVETQTLVDEINAYRPDYLYNHKNVLVRIAKYVKENNIEIWKPKFYTPISEMLDEPSNALLHEVFGDGLLDSYGLSETGACVVRLPGKDYYQISNDSHVVNIYNDDLSGPADAGMAVITNLYKIDLPLINYATLDYMERFEQFGLPFVSKIQGRMNDVIRHSNGGVTEWANISVVMNYTPEVVAYRITQETMTHCHLLMVRNPSVPASQQNQIAQSVVEGLAGVFKDPEMDVSVEWTDDIPSDANGKLRVIVSKI